MPKLRQTNVVKNYQEEKKPVKSFAAEACYMQLLEVVNMLVMRVEELEQTAQRRTVGKSIQRVEEFNGETVPAKEEIKEWGTTEEKIQCMVNAAKILPPNHVKDGRHSRENIEAICPFIVTEDLMDEMYSQFKHEA